MNRRQPDKVMVTHYRRKNSMKSKLHNFTTTVLLTAIAAQADVITDWNDIALPLLRAQPKISANRQFAIMHVAQFEAVNAVAGKYTPYVMNVAAPGASPEAAAAQAAHDILLRFYPTNQVALDAALAQSLASVA